MIPIKKWAGSKIDPNFFQASARVKAFLSLKKINWACPLSGQKGNTRVRNCHGIQWILTLFPLLTFFRFEFPATLKIRKYLKNSMILRVFSCKKTAMLAAYLRRKLFLRLFQLISAKKSPRLFRRKRCLILVFYDNCLFWRVPWDFVLNSLCFELTWVSNFGKNLSRYKQQVGIIFRLVWWNIYRINGPEAIKSHRRP